MNRVKPVIYQLVVRTFGNTNTTNRTDGPLAVNGCGKFADISDVALREIRKLGVTHVWLTGVLRQATLTDWSGLGLPPDSPDVVKGIAGSFYAVRDYFDVCPDYAIDPSNRLAEFDALVERVHKAGLKALIDFVPNHVARGYESIVRPDVHFGAGDDTGVFFSPHNHLFYITEPRGQPLRTERPAHWKPEGIAFTGRYAPEDGTPGHPVKVTGNNAATASPSAFDWYETIKLNYGWDFKAQVGQYEPRPRTWGVMDEVLAYWQGRGVDGFRCDFAHYVPPEAWAFLIGEMKRRDPSVYVFAEAYPYHGSGDPITDMQQLVDVGFDAVYHDNSYNVLKRIYQQVASQDDYNHAMVSVPESVRGRYLLYLENHDERRIASPVVKGVGNGESGFGWADAGYLLAPVQYLYGPGPVLLLNGQEVGEQGAGTEGYGGEDGRTTLFDYWSMPALVKWVNDHRYDGGGLDEWQRKLRHFYGDLLQLCQDESVTASSYWGLKYYNRPDVCPRCPSAFYSFARFEAGSGRLLLVVANFDREQAVLGPVRIPPELLALSGLPDEIEVRLRLDRGGAADRVVVRSSDKALVGDGFDVAIPAETTHVYVVSPARP
jgi:glycosidase